MTVKHVDDITEYLHINYLGDVLMGEKIGSSRSSYLFPVTIRNVRTVARTHILPARITPFNSVGTV